MTYERRNKGTCSVMTKVELNPDHTIESVEVLGGCNGNLKGICQLLKGMKAEDAIERMKGTLCGSKPTSCPDQIAITLEEALQKIATRQAAGEAITGPKKIGCYGASYLYPMF